MDHRMRDNHQVSWAVIAGAAFGGLIGFLFFTDRGRRLRARIEPAVDDLLEKAHGWRGAIEKVTAFANESGMMAGAVPPAPAPSDWSDGGSQPH
jgi:hypothetical protein